MQNKIDIDYFPGWTRKSLTFTMDDGNIPMDTKLLEILRPHGILGTFNLCSHILSYLTPEEYREFYKDYEIANHCKNHPIVFDDDAKYIVLDEPFDSLNSLDYTPENPVVYKSEHPEIYMMHHRLNRIKPDGWYRVATADSYIRFIDEGKRELEEVFGEGRINSFVWPCYAQSNTKVRAHLAESGYRSVRRTEDNLDPAFSLPQDRMDWSYNAHHANLLSRMAEYEALADDGELKFFAFGVHAKDFENAGNWDELRTFAEKYGDRPEDYYYASVGDILDYEDAKNALIITEDEIANPTNVKIYIKVNDKKVCVEPRSAYSVKDM